EALVDGPSVTQPVNSAPPTSTAGAAPAPPANASAPSAEIPGKKIGKRFWSIALVSVLVVVAIAFIARWAIDRATSSITDDAFIEAHIVNVAPQSVSGHLVRYLVEENDHV